MKEFACFHVTHETKFVYQLTCKFTIYFLIMCFETVNRFYFSLEMLSICSAWLVENHIEWWASMLCNGVLSWPEDSYMALLRIFQLFSILLTAKYSCRCSMLMKEFACFHLTHETEFVSQLTCKLSIYFVIMCLETVNRFYFSLEMLSICSAWFVENHTTQCNTL